MADETPLYILLTMMRREWGKDKFAEAVALAKLAAPYVHGRAPAVRQEGELAGVPDDELDDWDGGGGEAAAEAGAG